MMVHHHNLDDLSDTIDVLNHHFKLNQTKMKEESKWCLIKFNSCDKENDTQACKFLLKSLDTSLECEVNAQVEDDDTLIDKEPPRLANTHLGDVDELKILTPAN